jgi:anti-sigma factor ChrR (cupin superfamily)
MSGEGNDGRAAGEGLDYTLGALDLLAGRDEEAPREGLRQELLDLADAPSLPIETSAYAWEEPFPGIRIYEMRSDPSRNMRGCLVWARPGARTVPHRHLGDEVILVLQGALRDERGRYHAGQICRSRKGSAHVEEVLPGEDCFCYVVYYGGHELL